MIAMTLFDILFTNQTITFSFGLILLGVISAKSRRCQTFHNFMRSNFRNLSSQEKGTT